MRQKIIGVEAGYSGKYKVRYTYTLIVSFSLLLMVTVGDKMQGLDIAPCGFSYLYRTIKAWVSKFSWKLEA